jgi:hypothetical protein
VVSTLTALTYEMEDSISFDVVCSENRWNSQIRVIFFLAVQVYLFWMVPCSKFPPLSTSSERPRSLIRSAVSLPQIRRGLPLCRPVLESLQSTDALSNDIWPDKYANTVSIFSIYPIYNVFLASTYFVITSYHIEVFSLYISSCLIYY